MNQSFSTTTTKNGLEKPPLFQQWLNENQDLQPYIHPREWFLFVQFIFKSLKAYDPASVEAYLNDHFHLLFRKDIPHPLISRGMTHLRSLLLHQLLEDSESSTRPHEKDERIVRLIGIFDAIFQRIARRQAPAPGETEPADGRKNAGSHPQPQAAIFPFRIDGDRFEGITKVDVRFKQWLGAGVESGGGVSWTEVIHPKDLGKFKFRLTSAIRYQHPFYEWTYRLKNYRGEWREVIEFGRIYYDDQKHPAIYRGVIMALPDVVGEEGWQQNAGAILQQVMNVRKDFGFVVDEGGQLVFATRAVQESLFLPELAGDLPNARFFELLDSENKVMAREFWDTLDQGNRSGEGKTLLLKLRSGTGEGARIAEFAVYHLYRAFNEPHYLFWGRLMRGRRRMDESAERLASLQKVLKTLQTVPDTPTLYQEVIKGVQKVLPQARSAAVLLNTRRGLMFGVGFGYAGERISKSPLLGPDMLEQYWPVRPESQDIDLIQSPPLRNLLFDKLTRHSKYLPAQLHPPLKPGSYLLGGTRLKKKPYLLLEVCNFDPEHPFSEIDEAIFRILLQQTGIVLERLARADADVAANFEAIFQHSPLAMFVIQNDMCKRYNPQFLALTGQKSDWHPESRIWSLIHAEDLPGVKVAISRTQDTGGCYQQDFRMLRANDAEIYCEGTFIPIEHDGKPAVLCQVVDVTKLRELENQLRRAQKMESLGALTAGIAHDFNNILGTIIPSAEMIIHHPEDAEGNRKHAQIIFHIARRAALLNRKLQAFSLTEEEEPRRVNLNHIVEDARELLEKMVGPEVKIHYRLAEKLPDLTADYNQLMQLLINLVSNSREAIPEGSEGEIFITTDFTAVKPGKTWPRAVQPGEYVRLTVRDNGIGIPPELRQQIFKPFFTTKSADNSGLGLSIVRGILQRHEGYMMLQSMEKQGSTFRIYLPVDKHREEETVPAEKAAAVTAPPPPAPGVGPQTPPPRPAPPAEKAYRGTILVVDDEKHLRDVYVSMLEMMGFRCLQAGSGREALYKYKAHRNEIDLVILDYGMPDLNGRQTYLVLKKLNPHVRVILSTGYGEQEGVTRLVRDERLHFLPKPFTMESLKRRVAAALAHEKAPRR